MMIIKTANCNKEFTGDLDSIPIILKVEGFAKLMGFNMKKAYSIVKRKSFKKIKIGKTYHIPRAEMFKWMEDECHKEQFLENYYDLNEKEQNLAEEAFWKAVKFLDEQKKVDIERQDIIKLMSE